MEDIKDMNKSLNQIIHLQSLLMGVTACEGPSTIYDTCLDSCFEGGLQIGSISEHIHERVCVCVFTRG